MTNAANVNLVEVKQKRPRVLALLEEMPWLLGVRVKDRRQELGRSQQAVAAAMRRFGHPWHQTTVAKTEAGTRPLTLSEAASLAMVLRFPSVESLLGDQIPNYLTDAFVAFEQERADKSVRDVRKRIAENSPDFLPMFDQKMREAEESADQARARFADEYDEMRALLGLVSKGDSGGQHPEA